MRNNTNHAPILEEIVTSGVPLLEHTCAQLFITYSSLFQLTQTHLSQNTISPFQNALSLSLIIQRDLDHLLRTIDRYSLAS